MWGRAVIYRDPYRVVDEIEGLISAYGTNLIFFSDLTFNLDREKVVGLCEAIIRRNVRINWFCSCRPEGMDAELLELMKMAGCARIHFGIEAIDEISLRRLDRERTYRVIEKALRTVSDAGIITRAYLMIGYPWETMKHLESISKNLDRLHIDDLRISFFTPFPGTDIYDKHIHEISKEWDDYTTDKPMFENKQLTKEEILYMREKIYSNYHNSPQYYDRVARKVALYPRLAASFEEFFKDAGLSRLAIIERGACDER
jgi:radical SAM superfamily enzyme YgiQ (UPF0313 family)